MGRYIRKNIIPIIIEVVFILSCFIIPKEYFIYTNFIFYLLLLLRGVLYQETGREENHGKMKGGFSNQLIVGTVM